jgi:hypothetical protein
LSSAFSFLIVVQKASKSQAVFVQRHRKPSCKQLQRSPFSICVQSIADFVRLFRHSVAGKRRLYGSTKPTKKPSWKRSYRSIIFNEKCFTAVSLATTEHQDFFASPSNAKFKYEFLHNMATPEVPPSKFEPPSPTCSGRLNSVLLFQSSRVKPQFAYTVLL